MTTLYKDGVRIRGSCLEILEGQLVVAKVLGQWGYNCIVTSANDGVHGETSLHYAGAARDYRSKHINREDLYKIRDQIKAELKPLGDFDFILEAVNTDNEHFHMEWQPKRSAGYL